MSYSLHSHPPYSPLSFSQWINFRTMRIYVDERKYLVLYAKRYVCSPLYYVVSVWAKIQTTMNSFSLTLLGLQAKSVLPM